MLSSDGDDILRDILIRLPLKSVFRCKCVSKRWHHLISDPFFRISYVSHERRHQRQGRLLGFFKSPYKDIYHTAEYSWEFLQKLKVVAVSTCSPDKVEVEEEEEEEEEEEDIITSLESSGGILNYLGYFICSSNGLFLCGRYYTKKGEETYGVYHIYNPVSKESYRLPSPPPKNRFEPIWGRPRMGFVVAAADYASLASSSFSSIRYKVVRAEASFSNWYTRHIIGIEITPIIAIEIFSSETGKWTQSKASVNAKTFEFFRGPLEATVIRGAIHWKGEFLVMICVYDPYKKLLHREEEDHPEEVVIEIIDPPPVSFSGDHVVPSLIGESTDGLLQLVTLDCPKRNFINVWVYHSNECKWSLRHKMLKVADPIPPYVGLHEKFPVNLLALHPHNPEAVFINWNGFIYLYHFNTGTPRLEAIQYRGGHLSIPKYGGSFCTYIHVIPYFLPLWHISPYPLGHHYYKQRFRGRHRSSLISCSCLVCNRYFLQ